MYKIHVPIIKANAEYSDPWVAAIFRFVMHTIRRPFYEVGPLNVLTKPQKEGMRYVESNVKELRELLNSGISLEEKITRLLVVKGMNIPKVSFVLQLTGHEIGCIDTHNAKLLGLDQNDLIQRKDRPLNREKIWRYIGLCQSTKMGGSQTMWDNWCTMIAERYPDKFTDAKEVSRKHLYKIDEIECEHYFQGKNLA